MSGIPKTPPASNEIEVTLFGPGKGESILVHVGDGDWLCIDSALSERQSIPLAYLRQLGIPLDKVKLIVATHWHRDHVEGLAELLHCCPSAQFVCSAALRAAEFKQIVARFSSQDVGGATPPLSEIRKCFEILAGRKKASLVGYVPPIFAGANRLIASYKSSNGPIVIQALSPSDEDYLRALEAFAGYFVPLDQSATGLPSVDPNHASVVLAVAIGGELLLFGADLEVTSSVHTGWRAVLASKVRPQQPSLFFKVSHHGSSNARHPAVWTDMLVPDCFAAVTEYSGSAIPNEEQVNWLVGQSSNVYATGLPQRTHVRRRPEIEKTIREATKDFAAYRLPTAAGMVRMRRVVGSGPTWTVESFNGAMRLV
ncbi:MAG TPA: MBL fold metallo-hydrolase [Pseudolabrys sp.]|uniref:MBL fold metallo-hydrolase n=1 Tax=Pseudolabrys sp. TaxID=1960880 RepID=UPI002DDD33C2|nr:MBL fold metallo-hydrolase [Pseudolabrys sp.]HEV2631330.1 MBL fold metallo-hydrolase [Pseudolabrys sp.]